MPTPTSSSKAGPSDPMKTSQHRLRIPSRGILKNTDSLKYHSTYQFDDGNVFLLEFIHETRKSFEGKKSWKEGHQDSPGRSDKNPIILTDVAPSEFDLLLNFIYFGMHRSYSPSTYDWTTILKIAWRLEFEGIKEHAIAELTARKDDPVHGLSPENQIFIALHCGIRPWLEPAYAKLVYDPSPFSLDIAAKLPPEVAIMLSRARELYHHRNNWTWVSDAVEGNNVQYRHSWSEGTKAARKIKWIPTHRRSAEEIVKEQLAVLEGFETPRTPRAKRERWSERTNPSKYANRSSV